MGRKIAYNVFTGPREFVKGVLIQATKWYKGTGGIEPLIFNLGARRK
jgi:hypothetical protein